jgi:hypothetical protein
VGEAFMRAPDPGVELERLFAAPIPGLLQKSNKTAP